MRILHVISSMDPALGGVAQAVRLFAPELHRLGCESEVATVDPPDASWIRSNPALKIHALGPGKSNWAWSLRLLPWLKEQLSRFDAVVVHGLWQWPSLATWLAIHAMSNGA